MRTENIHLTTNQKSIIATIIQSDGAGVADDTLASSPNLEGALRQLIKLKMVRNSERDLYVLTPTGEKFAKNENIIDDSGSLTSDGEGAVIGNDNKIKESMTFKDYLMLT